MPDRNWAEEHCPRRDLHTPEPEQWGRQIWAEQMLRTHNQTRCPGCQLYLVWQPRRGAPKLPPIGYRLDHNTCGCCDGDDTRCRCTFHAEAVQALVRRTWYGRKTAKAAAGEG